MARLTIVDGEGAVAIEAAERLTGLIERSVSDRGAAVVSLTGGRTPRRLYGLLGSHAHPWRARIDWSKAHLFWGDERQVPPDHPESNYGMAHDALLRHVPVPSSQVHRMHGELADAREAADRYDRALRESFAEAGRGDLTFDVMLLGLGEDAHLASIFPGSELLAAGPERRVAAVWVPRLSAWRLTLTPAAILDARAIVMVVSGAAKADAVRAAVDAPDDVQRWPAQLLRSAGDRVTWVIDRAAAACLSS